MRKNGLGLISLCLAGILLAGCSTTKHYHMGYTGPVMDEDEYEYREETNGETAPTVPEVVIPTYTLMKVTTDTLNVRSGPGKNNETVGELHWGDLVALYEVEGSWGRIESGWVSLDYIEEHDPIISEDNDSRADGMPYKLMKITAKSLYIRCGAAKKYDSIGEFHQGDMVAVYETYDNWGRTDLGWINLEYAEDHDPGIQQNPPLDIERANDYIHPTIVGSWYRFGQIEEDAYCIQIADYLADGSGEGLTTYTYYAGDVEAEWDGGIPWEYTFDGICLDAFDGVEEEWSYYRMFIIDDILVCENAEKEEYFDKVYYTGGDLEDAIAAINRYHAKKYPPEAPSDPETDAIP